MIACGQPDLARSIEWAIFGVAVGRIGCYYAGIDDFTYATPTDLPWGHDLAMESCVIPRRSMKARPWRRS
jgi:hypothetical protein